MVGLSQSAISRLVVRLEAKSCGVLQRQICEDDRRGIYTRLTTLGEEKLQISLNTVHEILHSAFSKKPSRGITILNREIIIWFLYPL